MSPRFLKDELVVFIGHSADAQAEAEAVYGLESQFQEELRKHRLASTEGAPFTSVKCWEWTFDAEGTPGGQKTLVDPVIDTGHVAIFVFKERVGPVTRAELDDCRKHRAKKIPVYAIFPKKNPPDLSDEEAARQWLELLSYKRKLQADWTEPDSQALRPLEEYEDVAGLTTIVLGQFERDLPELIRNRRDVTASASEIDEQQQDSAGPHKLDADRDDFLSHVQEVCLLRDGGETRVETIRASSGMSYLRVSIGKDGLTRVYPVGAIQGDVNVEGFDAFKAIHRRYRRTDPGVISTLVYGGSPVEQSLAKEAAAERIRLRSFIEYQGLIDLRPYVERQTQRLVDDPVYPPNLYVPQSLRFQQDQKEQKALAVEQIEGWLHDDYGRFILVLGDFGTGKTFLLHELARRLAANRALTPVLVEMRELEKGRSLDELVAQHLARSGLERFDLRAFRYMLKEGRIALLFDGFDELALRVSYDRAAEHFATLVEATSGEAKVVVTSRTTHFESDQQVKTALGERVDLLPGRRIVHLQPFDKSQIRGFLANRLGGEEAAEARFAVIDEVKDLLGLSQNPRMLSFIADLSEEDLLAAKEREGEITSAELYRLILQRWLLHEYDRQQPKGALPALTVDQRWDAATQLALRLWQGTEKTMTVSELSDELAETLDNLVSGLSRGVATHQVGSGTLLVRDAEGAFSFIHQSVLEWLVARRVAQELRKTARSEVMGVREISPLMADFIGALAGREAADIWARSELSSFSAGEIVKKNALLMLGRIQMEPREPRVEPASNDSPEVADLAEQDLRGQDLSGRDLRRANLTRVDLTAAKMLGADLSGARLIDARLNNANLSRARLRGADLRGADLTDARLFEVDLDRAEVSDASFRRAALVKATLPKNTDKADFSGAARPEPETVAPWTGSASACRVVAWDNLGELMATGHEDGSVRIWNVAVEHEICRLLGHRSAVNSVAFSPDGKILATGSYDKTIKLWNIADGNLRATLRGHQNWVNSIAFNPDGKTLASGSYDKTVRLWDTSTGAHRATLQGHQNYVRGVAFSPDGKTLASGSYDKTVKLWDTSDGKHRATLQGHQNWVYCVAFSPDGKTLASGSSDKTVRLWDLANRKHRATLQGHQYGISSVAFSPDGKTLASGSKDNTVRLWNPDDGKSRATLQGHQYRVYSIVFSPDGKTLASGSKDKTIRLWNPANGKHRATLQGQRCRVSSVAFSPDGKTLASGSDDKTVRLWNPTDGKHRVTLQGHQYRISSVAFSPDGKTLASGSDDNTVRLWNPTDGRLRTTLQGQQFRTSSVAFSPDGKTLASGSDDNTVKLWNPTDGKLRTTLRGHKEWVSSVAFSPDGKTLASGSDDNTVKLWNPTDGDVRATLQGHQYRVSSVAFSPDGKTLASGSDDNTVRLWNPIDGDVRAALQGHQKWVSSVAFSPDGKTLASGSSDKTVRLWNPTDGKLRTTLRGHQNWVLSVAFSQDGKTIASGSDDNTVRLWDVATGRCLVILGHLPEGWVAYTPEGRYKLGGEIAGGFWHSINLCRFEPGELDPYLPEPLRMADDEPFFT